MEVESNHSAQPEEEEEAICRICRGHGDERRPLFHPCGCTGTIKYVHEDCLLRWTRYNRRDTCELCQQKFHFLNVYDESAPRTLSKFELVKGIIKILGKYSKKLARVGFVLIIWTVITPLLTGWLFDAMLLETWRNPRQFISSIANRNSLFFDLFIGSSVTISLLIIGLCLTAFKDFITQNRELILNRQRQQNAPPQQQQPPVNPPAVDDDDNTSSEDETDEVTEDENVENNVQEINNPLPPLAPEDLPNNNDANAIPNANNMNENAANDIANNLVNNLDNEEVDLEEIIGLNGRLVSLFESWLFVMFSNFIYLSLVIFTPFNIGFYASKIIDYKETPLFSSVASYSTTLSQLLFGYAVLMLTFAIIVMGICMSYNFLPILQRNPLITFIYQIIMYGYTFVKLICFTTINFILVPIYCGVFTNLATADFFGVTVQERLNSIQSEPISSVVIHFLMGIFYLFLLSFFVRTLREFLRPGVLWFLNNPDDPNYSYIKDLIKTPLFTQIRRHVMTVLMFAVIISSLLRGPLKLLKELFPHLFPLHATLSTPLLQAATDIFLFMFLLLVAIENIQLKPFVKPFLQRWFYAVGNLLNMNSYLFGNPAINEEQDNAPPIVYKAPYFPVRVVMLLVFGWATLNLIICILILLPLLIGRKLAVLSGASPVNDMYAYAVGWFIVLCIIFALKKLAGLLLHHPLTESIKKVFFIALTVIKILIAGFFMALVTPTLLGIAVHMVMIFPLNVPILQTPVFFLPECWFAGCVLLMFQVKRFMRRWFPQVVLHFARKRWDFELWFVLKELVIPVLYQLSVFVFVPYLFGKIVLPILVDTVLKPYFLSEEFDTFYMQNVFLRYVHLVHTLLYVLNWIRKGVVFLYQFIETKIRDENYLKQRRLLNRDQVAPAPAPVPQNTQQELLQQEQQQQEPLQQN